MDPYLIGLRERRPVTNSYSTISELTTNLVYPLGALKRALDFFLGAIPKSKAK
jgi:hypothetical protein